MVSLMQADLSLKAKPREEHVIFRFAVQHFIIEIPSNIDIYRR
jgi:hypothetical protein